MRYLDFPIQIDRPSGEEYPVRIVGSPAGDGQGSFRLPFPKERLPALLAHLRRAVLASAAGPGEGSARSFTLALPEGATSSAPSEVGEQLFAALFSGEILGLLLTSVGKIEEQEGLGLRLRLQVDPHDPELAPLASLPWEILFWQERGSFLSLSRKTPVVRYLSVPRAPKPLLERPLRILLATAAPSGYPALDLERESGTIEATLNSLTGVDVERLPAASPVALRQKLVDESFHVLHFMGHGDFDSTSAEGSLVFEDGRGGPALLPARALAQMLQDADSLRLVFLNACESAGASAEPGLDPFSSTAAALVRAGLPAVLAMQFPISDTAAVAFSETFYRTLAQGEPVDAATVEGRMAVYLGNTRSLEWSTPALFLRSPDGRLFEPGSDSPGGTAHEVRARVLSFTVLVRNKTEGFVGRRWAFEAIDRFTREETRGYFSLRGDPGIGKSALLAQLVKQYGYCHHFNVRATGENRPVDFLGNICAQLITTYGLGDRALPPEATTNGRYLVALLERVAAKLTAGEKAILVVDALDEADTSGQPPGVNTLYLPVDLPDGVFCVVTARRETLRLHLDCPQRLLDIAQGSEENLADVREYLVSRLPRPGLQAFLAAQYLDEPTFVREMAEKSQGNFMYLRYVLPEIELGAYTDRRFATLPVGLAGYYEDHWRRMRTSDEERWRTCSLPVLAALTVAEEPVPIDLLTELSGVTDRRAVRSVLREWRPFLHEEGEGPYRLYRLYHASFHEFIAAKDEVADEHVNLKEAHARIADALWKRSDGDV